TVGESRARRGRSQGLRADLGAREDAPASCGVAELERKSTRIRGELAPSGNHEITKITKSNQRFRDFRVFRVFVGSGSLLPFWAIGQQRTHGTVRIGFRTGRRAVVSQIEERAAVTVDRLGALPRDGLA